MSNIIHHKSTVKAVITTVICILLMSAFPWNAQAQERHNILHRLDSLLSIRYMRADIDTHYIMRPPTKWTIRGRLNVSGAKIMAEGVNITYPCATTSPRLSSPAAEPLSTSGEIYSTASPVSLTSQTSVMKTA